MIAEIGSGIAVSRNRPIPDPVEVPYLRVANVLRGHLDLSDVKTIRVDSDRLPHLLLAKDDILFTEGGDRDKLGRGWVWEGQIENCVHQNHVFRARLVDQHLVNPRFISYWGNTFGQIFFLEHATQTTNLASINRSVLSRLPVPIPPVSEQKEIMRQLSHRLSAADQLAAKLEQQLIRTQEARQSLLGEAFVGLLVEQNAADEPAFLLLERIRTARNIEAFERKLRSTSMPKSSKKIVGPRELLAVLKENGASMTPEELFRVSGHTQDSVEQFYAELRELTTAPTKIVEERTTQGTIRLAVLP